MCALMLLLAGLVLQPVLAAVGEAHELAHASELESGGHVGADHAGAPDDDAGDGEEGSPLHAALHFAHCCGNAPTGLPAGGVAVAAAAPAAAPATQTPLRLRDLATDPLRPPIA